MHRFHKVFARFLVALVFISFGILSKVARAQASDDDFANEEQESGFGSSAGFEVNLLYRYLPTQNLKQQRWPAKVLRRPFVPEGEAYAPAAFELGTPKKSPR
jgi:hypothetical protein